jgi:hypothetical protein
VKIPTGWKLTSDTSISTDDGRHYVLRFDLRISARYEAWRQGQRGFLGNFGTAELAVAACDADRKRITSEGS